MFLLNAYVLVGGVTVDGHALPAGVVGLDAVAGARDAAVDAAVRAAGDATGVLAGGARLVDGVEQAVADEDEHGEAENGDEDGAGGGSAQRMRRAR